MVDDRDRLVRDDTGPTRGGSYPANPGVPSFVGRITTEHPYLGTFVNVQRVTLLGTEGEGETATTDGDNANILVYVLGPATPKKDDLVICTRVADRWVTERLARHGAFVFQSLCICSYLPTTVNMTVTGEQYNAHIYQSCTLKWMNPRPAVWDAMNLPKAIYQSTEKYYDDNWVKGSGGHDNGFYYYMRCFQGAHIVERIYTDTVQGGNNNWFFYGPVILSVLPGGPNNTCHPFKMHSVQLRPTGMDTRTVIHLDEDEA